MAVKASVSSPKYGEWAFLLGIILAIVVGVFSSQLGVATAYLVAVLAILGLVVGLLNISEKETTEFLIAAIALLGVANSWSPIAGMFTLLLGNFGLTATQWLSGFFSSLAVFVAPAALIVSLKAIYNLASSS